MVILPATEADLQAVIELRRPGARGIGPSGRRPVAGRLSLAGDDPARPAARRRTHRAHRRCGGRLRRLLLRRRTGLRPDRGGRLGRRRALCGGAPAGRGRALRAAGHCRRVAARSRPQALVRGIRSFRIDTHPDNGPMRALLVRRGSPVGARCATKPCGWLTRSRSSADPLRYVTASGDGCRNIRADDLNQGGYIPFCTAAPPKRAFVRPPGGSRSANAALPRMLRQSVVCSGSENRRGAELYTAA